jgi:hypothetical protein
MKIQNSLRIHKKENSVWQNSRKNVVFWPEMCVKSSNQASENAKKGLLSGR